MKTTKYPSPEELVKLNEIALTEIKVKKADKPVLLSKSKIQDIIRRCRYTKGDIYDKAVFLIEALIQKHPFASGNRRTAFLAAKDFLEINKSKFGVDNIPENSKVMLGIREGYYSSIEVKEWLKNGKIRSFQR
jgi:death-on-curing family protein